MPAVLRDSYLYSNGPQLCRSLALYLPWDTGWAASLFQALFLL